MVEYGSSEISGKPVPRSTRNRQVVERSEVLSQIEAVIQRVLSYTTREQKRGAKGFPLVWLFGFSYEPSVLEICVVTRVTVAREMFNMIQNTATHQVYADGIDWVSPRQFHSVL